MSSRFRTWWRPVVFIGLAMSALTARAAFAQSGACCRDSGLCSSLTPKLCEPLGREFVGGPCDPNPCRSACCRANGGCDDNLSRNFCTSTGGTYQGHNTNCDQSTCPMLPNGACCGTFSCRDGVTAEFCAGQSGDEYLGDGSTCAVDCEHGACCFPDDHCEDLPATECPGPSLVYGGNLVPCPPLGCGQGACCLPTIDPAGECFGPIDPFNCGGSGGMHGGTGSDCATTTCPRFGGACCCSTSCFVTTEDKCDLFGFCIFVGERIGCGNDGISFVCPGDGACCTPGGCVLADALTCDVIVGEYQGEDSTCTPDPCAGGGCNFDADCADGLFCNGREICVSGSCQPGTPRNCADFVDCTDDSCNEAFDRCDNIPNNTPCDDQNPCTEDRCDFHEGCTNTVIEDCGACCTPETGGCIDGETESCCDDFGDFQGNGSRCAEVDCPPPSVACCLSDGRCIDVPSEQCVEPDGVAVVGSCFSTECCVTNTDCEDSVFCTEDSCDPATRQCVFTPNDVLCFTTDLCSVNEVCDPDLDCLNEPVECDDGIDCTSDSCDPATGQCVITPIDENCSDEDLCTVKERCDPGSGCVSDRVSCDDGFSCTDDACDPVTGACLNTANTAACGDSDLCTNDACAPENPNHGLDGCVHEPVDCDDGIDCTNDSCDPATGQCVITPNDTGCSDENLCTVNEHCDPGSGCVSDPVVCDDDDACTTDTCDPLTGCVHTPHECDDQNDCTIDSCDPATGECVFTNICGACCFVSEFVAGCDDALTLEECEQRPFFSFRPGQTCAEVNDCLGACCIPEGGCEEDVSEGFCESVFGENGVYRGDNTDCCDDNDACNGLETCDLNGDCQPGTAPDCDDGFNCTTDDCNPVTGCTHTPNNDDCRDEDECTINERCDENQGCLTDPKDCSDAHDCTVDSCQSPSGDCVHTPVDEECSDAFACTIDTCDPNIGCLNGAEHTRCNDSVPCTTDRCEPNNPDVDQEGCVYRPVDCDDLSACTDDSCDPVTGECVNDDVNCDDGDDCTTDSCDPDSGCDNVRIEGCCNTDADCQDGDSCTTHVCDPHVGCVLTNDICGACCSSDVATEAECENLSEPNCLANAGGQFRGAGTRCEGLDPPCHGACCKLAVGCIDSTPEGCSNAGDTFFGMGTTCVGQPCGACCILEQGCEDGSDDSCTALGEFFPEELCADVPCGACCDPGGTCTHGSLEADCIAEPGNDFRGNGSKCLIPADAACGTSCGIDEHCRTTPPDACHGPERCVDNECVPGDAINCDDGDDCTTDSCDQESGCENVRIEGCCETVADCDDGAECTTHVCDPQVGCVLTGDVCGACCRVGEECLDQQTEATCSGAFDTFFGVGSTCATEPCGACCDTDSGVCTDGITESECTAADKAFQGSKTNCILDACVGACCNPSFVVGGCVPNLTPEECAAVDVDAIFTGVGTTCENAPCGACCDPLSSTTATSCLDTATAEFCDALEYVYRGDQTKCADDPCTGACCLPDGSCTVTAPEECPGDFRGNGTACDELNPSCSPFVGGACCVADGTCVDGTSPESCERVLSGRHQGDETRCEDVDCGLTGACCLPDDTCVQATAARCLDGTFQGAGSACPDACVVPGDANGDGHVDLADGRELFNAFGQQVEPGDPAEMLDLDGNGLIDLQDIAIFLQNINGPG